MTAILKHEFRINLKSLIIWSLSVGGMGFLCILMYTSMEGEVADMADMFSNMGAFSDAFGMSTLSIATLSGFFATEVGTVHGLGSAMFAAIMATVLLSKEEDAHTGEFLYSLPVSRSRIVIAKGIALLLQLVAFTLICGALYVLGFAALKEEVPWEGFLTLMGRMLIMNFEIAAIAILISACSAKNRIGLGLGLSLMFYAYDLIGRVIPDMKDYLFLGPFAAANASEILSGKDEPLKALITAAVLSVAALVSAFMIYTKKDLAS